MQEYTPYGFAAEVQGRRGRQAGLARVSLLALLVYVEGGAQEGMRGRHERQLQPVANDEARDREVALRGKARLQVRVCKGSKGGEGRLSEGGWRVAARAHGRGGRGVRG